MTQPPSPQRPPSPHSPHSSYTQALPADGEPSGSTAASALAATPAYAVRFANADNVVTGVQWQASTGRLALGSTVQVQ